MTFSLGTSLACRAVAIAAFLSLAPSVLAAGGQPQTTYPNVCINAVSTYNFGCESEHGALSQCFCDSDAFVNSVFACVDAHIPEGHKEEGRSYLAASCGWGQADVEKRIEASKSVNGTEPKSEKKEVKEAFLVSHLTYTKTFNNLEGRFHTQWACIAYGASLLGYWGCVLVLKIFTNMIKKFGMGVLKTFDNLLIRRIRRHIILAPTFSYRHSTPVYIGKWTLQLPSRQQSLIVLGACILNLIFVFVDHHIPMPNTRAHSMLLSGYIGQRTGFLTMFLFPLLILFGGRNNFLLWLTGWPLDTFNVFHKWIGRIVVVDLFIHAVVYSVDEMIAGKYHKVMKANWMIWGFVGFVAGCFILLQANHYFRSLSYEIFLVLHIVLAIFFMVGAWYHFAHFHQGYEMLYAGIAVWAVDRIGRWVRMAWSGAVIPGQIRYFPASEVLEIKIKYSKWWKFYPGCYAFIHVLNGMHFWQSHPFTLVEDPKVRGQLKIFSKVKKGMTRRVANAALKAPNNAMNVRLALEGPYGPHAPVHHYDTAVLIAGGIGVTATYAYAADSIKRDSRQRVIFIWVVSSESALEWFHDELVHLARHPRVELMVYVSSSSSQTSSTAVSHAGSSASSFDESKHAEKNAVRDSVIDTSHIARTYGRPNLRQIVSEEMLDSPGTSAFVVCGPGGLNDDVRISIAENLCQAKGRTDYFEEAFSW